MEDCGSERVRVSKSHFPSQDSLSLSFQHQLTQDYSQRAWDSVHNSVCFLFGLLALSLRVQVQQLIPCPRFCGLLVMVSSPAGRRNHVHSVEPIARTDSTGHRTDRCKCQPDTGQATQNGSLWCPHCLLQLHPVSELSPGRMPSKRGVGVAFGQDSLAGHGSGKAAIRWLLLFCFLFA